MNRKAPCTPSSDHSKICSGGAANIMNSRAVSAPNSSTNACGSTPLFLDFDMVTTPPDSTSLPSARSTRHPALRRLIGGDRHIGRIEVLHPARVGLAKEDLVQHHALREQIAQTVP